MRTLPLLASAALALGLAFGATAPAHAGDMRVFVSVGDVMFSAGQPYHRHHRYPLHVTYAPQGPRYYYYAPPAPAYSMPVPVHYHYGYHYRPAPPPPRPRPGYHRYRPGYSR